METTKKSPKITDYDTNSKTPFTVELSMRSFIPKTDEYVVTDTATGEMFAQRKIPKSKEIIHDGALYTKIYKGNGKKLYELTEPSNRMFNYMIEYLQPGKDEICILREDYLRYAGYKETGRLTYYRAIEGLLAANIIARKTGAPECFFINPNILYNGDRTKFSNTVLQDNRKSFSFSNNSNQINNNSTQNSNNE